MAEIPTMACEACSGNGYVTKSDGPQTCRGCYGRRRIPRPPLPAEEVAALPDGARVVVRTPQGVVGRANWWRQRGWLYRSTADSLPCSYYEPHECRVWLADDGGEGGHG